MGTRARPPFAIGDLIPATAAVAAAGTLAAILTASAPALAQPMFGAQKSPDAAFVQNVPPTPSCTYHVREDGKDPDQDQSHDGKMPEKAWRTVGQAVKVLTA
jgi:hypothetical protein